MSKRKKMSSSASEPPMNDSVTTRAVVSPEVLKQAMGDVSEASAEEPSERMTGETVIAPAAGSAPEASEALDEAMPESVDVPMSRDLGEFDAEMTVNLVGDLRMPGRDDLDAETVNSPGEALQEVDRLLLQRKHLRGLVEALVFASDAPIKLHDLAKLASASQKQVKELLDELKVDYATRGIHLDEVAGGWVFRTGSQYAPFVRDLTKQKPVRLTRAQVETLAIIAYRQPITRPEVDDVRGVDSGPVLKLLLERDLVRILGKRDEPGRPMIYGTTTQFLEFFGLKSLKDLPTLREFTELSDESREAFEDELSETGDIGEEAGETPTGASEGEGHEAERERGSEPGEPRDAARRSVHESMRVPVGEQDDDESDLIAELERASEGDPHASDDDGPTLTSEAPPPLDDE